MLLVRNTMEEREEGEITEYEDISSDEECLLRQRIAEIEASNLELERIATLADKIDGKENQSGRNPLNQAKAPAKVNARAPRATRRCTMTLRKRPPPAKSKPQPVSVTPARRRRRSRRRRKHSCQLILSDDEFDSYDQLPLGTENLSPDPLPIDDEDGIIEVPDDDDEADKAQEEEEDDDLELKLRLEALQSKQEIKNELKVILEQTQGSAGETPPKKTPPPPPPQLDEEQELRLIALKSAIVKKHLNRKKKKEEARPYSPTDVLENFDVPSPPISAQNMDISPLGTPSPLSELENSNPVDMDIANDEESQSPIFFACTVNTEVTDPEALSRVEIQMDPGIMVADSGYDDEDPEKLRAFLLEKIGEAAKRKEMRVMQENGDSLTGSEKAAEENSRETNSETSKVEEKVSERNFGEKSEGAEEVIRRNHASVEEDEDEHILRAKLLSKAKKLKRARSEEALTEFVPLKKPLSEILSEQSKRTMELKTICRTIENNPPMAMEEEEEEDVSLSVSTTINSPVSSPKPAPNTSLSRSALISEMPPIRVTPVIISLRASDQDSTSEYSEDDQENSLAMDLGDNDSPMSVAMDSPKYSSSPVPMANSPAAAPLKENFDVQLSEFLKKARQSTDSENKQETVKRAGQIKRIVTARKMVNKGAAVVNSAVQLGAPAAVKHLPPSTQLEYNRLINRMHQLERQKQQKLKQQRAKQNQEPKKAVGTVSTPTTPSGVKAKPSPIKSPISAEANAVSVIKRTPITVLVHNNNHLGSTEDLPSREVLVPQEAGDKQQQLRDKEAVPSEGKPAQSPGRITLKERLKSLTSEQMKMLLDVQQRKVVNKRKNLNQSLDTFLDTMRETMNANRQQIRTELEVRRLKRLLKLKEAQLVEQRRLCDGQWHERLQGQYKSVVVARQSLAMVSSQCLEIGRSAEKAEEFRLTDEGAEGLGAKFRRYKTEIESYKQLRQKIKKGVFTVADLKAAVVEKEAETQVSNGTVEEKEGDQQKEAQEENKESQSKEAIAEVVKINEQNSRDDLGSAKTALPIYKSPLEHMEYLDNANPNGILCPFQLNGTCQDEKCSYQHLAPSSTTV